MKKKFIAVSVLICALALGSTTLTSCVDDNESASVTAIRDAKAAQLNALAAEANANAKVNEALAALKQAKADAIKVQTEFEQQEYAARLEKLKAEYAQAIAEAQKKQATAEQKMQENLMDHQKELYKNYKAAQNEVTTLSNSIATKSVEVAELEAGLITAQKYAAQKVIEYRIDSLQAEAQKAAYVAMGENNYEELIKEAENLEVQRETLNTEVTAKRNEYIAAGDAFSKAKWAFEGGSQNVNGSIAFIEPTLETGKAINKIEELGYTYNVLKSDKQYVNAEDPSSTSIDVWSIDEAGLLRINAMLDQSLLNDEQELGTKDDKAGTHLYDSDADPDTPDEVVIWTDANKDNIMTPDEITNPTKWGEYLFWENNYKNAKKAWEDAKDEMKEQYRIWMDQAEATMIDKKAELITALEESIAETKETKAALKKATDAFTGDTYKAYTDAITAVLAKEGKAYDDAAKAVNTALLKVAEIDGKIKAINYLIGNNGTVININEKIAECETEIAEATQNIKEAQMLIYNPEDDGNKYGENTTAQTLLDKAKAELEDLNEKLAIAQAAEKSWKEQLEASLKGEIPSVPETPEEGGEETPAE